MMQSMRRRARSAAALLVVLALGLAGCLPSDGAPGSPGVPVLGLSRLAPAELVSWYRAKAPSTLPYRATGASLEQLAELFVTEGNRYHVRGDLAFAQSIVETAWFNFPDHGLVRPHNNNFSGIGACDSCPGGFQFSSALAGVRAQIQLLRSYADIASRTRYHPRPAGAGAVGEQPGDRRLQLRQPLPQGPRAAVEHDGQRHTGPRRPCTHPRSSASTTRCSSSPAKPDSARPTGCSSARSPTWGPARSACASPDVPSARRHGAATTC